MKHKCSTSSLAAQIPTEPERVRLIVSITVFGSFEGALAHLYRLWCCAGYRLSLRCLFSLSLSLPPSHDGKNICRQQEHTGTALSLSLTRSLSHPCDLSGRQASLCTVSSPQLMSLCVFGANESECSVCWRPGVHLCFTSLAPVSSVVRLKWRAVFQHISSGSERLL